jgi:hypothetical protein
MADGQLAELPRPAIILQRRSCWIGLIAIERKQFQISVPELRATGRSDICLAKPSGHIMAARGIDASNDES